MGLTLIHRAAGPEPAADGALVWRTCLREIVFVDGDVAGTDRAALVGDEDAYALLLEVVCGLRSPVVGETEVQAQFKAFLSALSPVTHGELLKTGQRLLADAKGIRERHLQGYGARSYGHLAARHVPAGRRVVLVGTGALAEEILTALGAGHPIDQWGRRAPLSSAIPIHVRAYLIHDAALPATMATEDVALVIAAPIGGADLQSVVRRYPHVREIVDLRSLDERTVFDVAAHVVTLETLFAEAAVDTPAATGPIDAARADIVRLARAYARREELRPFGWDDLCA